MAFTQGEWEMQLAKAMVAINAPYRAVDNEEFRQCFAMLKQDLRVPRSPKIRKLVAGYVEKMEQDLLKDMVLGSKLSVAYDCWTSPNNHAFLAVIGYFIDKDWQMREVLLGFEHLEGPHAGRNLAEAVVNVLRKYGVLDRVVAITTDNASNNTSAMPFIRRYVSRGTKETFHLPCLAHVIQLALKALLKTLDAEPTIDAEVEVWNEEMAEQVSEKTGFLLVIEKVRAAGPSSYCRPQ